MNPPNLREIAETMHAQLLRSVHAATGTYQLDGTCVFGSLLVLAAVKNFARQEACIRGGSGENDGALDSSGKWRGHYWVEVLAPEPTIIDITAGQFGWPDVLVCPAKDLDDRYRPGYQGLVDEHVAEVRRFLAETDGTSVVPTREI
jgi:hypothetical protein